MAARWEHFLKRWTDAGLIQPATAELVRAYETEQEKAHGLRWPALLAIGLGGVLMAAGVLLFVAAHWDGLSPSERFGLVLGLVAFFHVVGALLVERFSILSTALHAIGTVCLGAGIFLSGQIFNLQEHWPAGVMIWALGAWLAWSLLRDWPQAVSVAVLTPLWLGAEWTEATHGWFGSGRILAEGLLLLAITYLTALMPGKETTIRKALAWIGGLALIPGTVAVTLATGIVYPGSFGTSQSPLPDSYHYLWWAIALALPLVLSWVLRLKATWMNVVAALWVIALGTTNLRYHVGTVSSDLWYALGRYGMCALGSIGLIAWGLYEARKERVNLGVAGFGLTVLFFYFSTVMDKLGRSASLIGLGFLFLLGGWLLEKMRRRLVARMENKS